MSLNAIKEVTKVFKKENSEFNVFIAYRWSVCYTYSVCLIGKLDLLTITVITYFRWV